MRVMLGITGASGAPYAARVLRALCDAGVDTGICASAAGRQVIALELYGDREMDGSDTLERFVADHGQPGVRLWGERDYSAPYASGSSRTDAVVICPCSMASIGTIVGGSEANLIHRAAGVQLKERRKLVVVPRETPLSAIHLENLLKLRNAGADVIPAMPAFYHLPQTIDEMIDFVAGRVIDSLGIEMSLHPRWGEAEVPSQ
ncbi:MAG: flavin prenyltransferase [Gaiellales bacterium]|nr:flavin prenyltransferase [Gaiellales bacterium]